MENGANKKNYSVGESLDVTGGVITATYSDNSTKDIDVTADMVSGFNSAAVAEQQALTVTYGTKTLVYNIEVTGQPVQKIMNSGLMLLRLM